MTAATKTQYVYSFGKDVPSPPLDKFLLGGKGKGLAEMASIGMPVPPGFIITTDACHDWQKEGKKFPPGLDQQIQAALEVLEGQMGAKLGDPNNPLLVSVRSGAPVSMPGMMDTILNLGLNDQTVEGFAKKAGNERLAYDSYRRLIMMYADIVEGVPRKIFEQAFKILKDEEEAPLDIDLSIEGLKEACVQFKVIYQMQKGSPFPQDIREQLMKSIHAVFNSWDSERAVLYRQVNHIPDHLGTAVMVETMVFGNKNQNSATGVGFTRDPATGVKHFYGEFLLNAQGEEVVAGIRTPHPLNKYQKEENKSSLESLEELMPAVYEELRSIVERLEHHYKDMQDIEFTIDDGKLFMLQTRSGKRTGFAAIRMAVEMLEEGLIDEKTALKRVDPHQLVQLLAPIFDQKNKQTALDKLVAKGINAGPGAATGRLVFTKEKALEVKEKGGRAILVREETNPNDYPGMVAAEGILTMRGGSTSHAAVVARGMGKPCVVGCTALQINEKAGTLSVKDQTVKEGDPISIDGTTGEVFFCEIPTSPSEVLQVLVTKTKRPEESLVYQQYQKIMDLANRHRTLGVRANADTPLDCQVAKAFGADGVGLCRTEHMFMESDRLNDVRRMLFSELSEERQSAIDRLLPHQKEDFIGIFKEMDGLPVTIRLLDPPRHEFMPHSDKELHALADSMKMPVEQLAEMRDTLKEHNPMLGHRGCRLGITMPELTEMQTRAILEAAIEVAATGVHVIPEIMLPLVGIKNELIHQKALIQRTAAQVFKEKGTTIPFLIGTMIELPRACLIADEIAREAEFFSFGTNDLTQTIFGLSRDDSSKFLPFYVNGVPDPAHPGEILHILRDNPFQVLDREGVGGLMKFALVRGKTTRPELKCGICGEHGGDPLSVAFCHQIGLNYVSCSPYRVPVASLAAAQANL